MRVSTAAALLAAFLLTAFGPALAQEFKITSPAFQTGGKIDKAFTCDGKDVSPALSWTGAPAGTKSFALVVEDPDAPAGVWDHWVVYNIPAANKGLAENVPRDKELPDGSRQGRNGWRKIGYGGPCPPSGSHRYFFKLYALDTVLDLDPGASKSKLEKAMKGRILATAESMAKFR